MAKEEEEDSSGRGPLDCDYSGKVHVGLNRAVLGGQSIPKALKFLNSFANRAKSKNPALLSFQKPHPSSAPLSLSHKHTQVHNPYLLSLSRTARRWESKKGDGDEHRDDGIGVLRGQIGDLVVDQLDSATQPLQSRRGLLFPFFPQFRDFNLWLNINFPTLCRALLLV